MIRSLRLNCAVCQLTTYWFPTRRTVSDPGPVVVVKVAIVAPQTVPMRAQICTTGLIPGLNTPTKLGGGTMGGKNQKCVFPACAPSRI